MSLRSRVQQRRCDPCGVSARRQPNQNRVMGKTKNKKSSADLGGRLLLVGAVLFAVSWLVPVYQGQELFGALPGWGARLGAPPEGMLGAISGPDWLPGWSACKFAWQLLTATDSPVPQDDRWKQYLLGATCLTNGLMVLGLLLAAARRLPLAIGLVMLAAAVANGSWIYLADQNPFELYRAGYFLWLASFVLVAVGALLRAGKR